MFSMQLNMDSVLRMFDIRFLVGFLLCLFLCLLIVAYRRRQSIKLKSGNLEYCVDIDSFLGEQTWRLGYRSSAEVPLRMADCGKVVVYAGMRYRLSGFKSGPTPTLKSIR
jgi:hypothetical protein